MENGYTFRKLFLRSKAHLSKNSYRPLFIQTASTCPINSSQSAPMYSEVAVNVLGTMGTVCWCIQLVPQIIRNYKVKECLGVPPSMMFLWALSGIPFLIYFLGIDALIPLRIQPQLFTFFCLISWIQTLYYPPVKLDKMRLVVYVCSFVVPSVGVEIGLILWLRPLYRQGKHWPMLVVGILALILLTAGLIPPYFELAKRRGRVVGINFIFLTMDSLGALLSLLSLCWGNRDIMSMVLYILVLALELGIFASQIGWYLTGGRKVLRDEKNERKRLKMEKGEDHEAVPLDTKNGFSEPSHNNVRETSSEHLLLALQAREEVS